MLNAFSRITPCLALTLLSLSPTLRADDATASAPRPSTTGLILSAGLGPSESGILGVVSIQSRHRSHLFGLRLASASRFELFGDSPTPSNTEYGLLYGRYAAKRKGYTSLSAGVSVVSSLRPGRLLATDCSFLFGCSKRFERVVTRNVGIPFEAKAVLSTRYAGLGLGLMGNLNPKGSFIGVGVTFELGSLR